MPSIPKSIVNAIDAPFALSPQQVSFFEKNRFIKLKQVLDTDAIHFFNEVISSKVSQTKTVMASMEERDTYGKAFLQVFNLWREDDRIKSLVFSKRLAKIATDLMQVKGVRLYHDQALFKEGGGGITPWHADQYYWPLETDKSITAWIPLQQTPMEMGPLEFSAASHRIVEGRELAIGDESENIMEQRLKVTDFKRVIEPFDLGEVSFHSGWVFHRAGPNTTNKMRKVMTIIYMDRDMILKNPENKNQVLDWNTWCPGAEIGKVINSPINPVLFQYE